MDNNLDFKNIWQQQKGSQPDIDKLFKTVNKYKSTNLRKLVFANILLLLTCGFISWIWVHYQPELISTKAGIVLVILAMIVFLFQYNKLFKFFSQADSTQTNKHYLQSLRELKDKQHFIQTTAMGVYFIALSLGLCLYFYEYVSRMPISWGILTYALSLAWIGLNWFYIRPKIVKKQQKKLDELISKFETLNQQLEEE
jgi:hypothetical protein